VFLSFDDRPDLYRSAEARNGCRVLGTCDDNLTPVALGTARRRTLISERDLAM